MSSDIKPSLFFIANLLNFVLATGVFTLPFSFYESGFILGTIILTTTCWLSIIACSFIIESLAIQNSFRKEENIVINHASIHKNELKYSNNNDSTLSQVFPTKPSKFLTPKDVEENTNLAGVKKNLLDNTQTDSSEMEEQDSFYIFKRYEISKLACKAFNKPLYFSCVMVIICYLYIGLTSNSVIAGNSLKFIISKTFDVELPDYSYYVIVGIFYLCIFLMSLNNINNLKKLSMFIMVCRFLMIFLVMGCCVYSIVKYGTAKYEELPKADFKNITIMIGNSLFFFMSHHSMPGMVENFKPQKNLIKLLIIGYSFSLGIMLIYGYLSLIAFAQYKNCDMNQFPCAIQNMFSLNFISLPVVGYVINYYPIFNVITSAMQTITLKNNILQAIGNCSPELAKKINFNEKPGCSAMFYNFISNVIICIPAICLAFLLNNIQDIMKYFSSIFGFFLMLVIPNLLVVSFREKYKKFSLTSGKINKSFVQNYWVLRFLDVLAVSMLVMIIYGFFHKNTKTCVAEAD